MVYNICIPSLLLLSVLVLPPPLRLSVPPLISTTTHQILPSISLFRPLPALPPPPPSHTHTHVHRPGDAEGPARGLPDIYKYIAWLARYIYII